ncbi:pentapeptide repeat-containing protein [Actinokineospora enzanensis]|uniref:pentapeptide repeat-containing protein n=1 Tax=Actinokineospora enzanensis TaxID=155975 RepID=UPI0003620AEF
MQWVFLVAGLVSLVAGVVLGVGSVLSRKSRRDTERKPERYWLAAAILVSVGLLGVVTGWLMTEPNANRGEALKTGGLAGGAIVALYALWLNDRRRRVEERRQDIERRKHDLESERAEFDRERVADERFAKAVELLGNDASQVRGGALHVLAGLARARPAYTQTVLDVFCSYLRKPFMRGSDQSEAQVRGTAQRLIAELLPPADSPGPYLDLDLTGADLEYFDISNRAVGRMYLRGARLHESNALWGCQFHNDVYLTAAVNLGRLHLHHTVFHRNAWFSRFISYGPAHFQDTEFRGENKFRGARFHDRLQLH